MLLIQWALKKLNSAYHITFHKDLRLIEGEGVDES